MGHELLCGQSIQEEVHLVYTQGRGLRRLRFPDVTPRNDANQFIFFDHWQAANVVFDHKPERFRQRRLWGDGNRVGGHPVANNLGVHRNTPFAYYLLSHQDRHGASVPLFWGQMTLHVRSKIIYKEAIRSVYMNGQPVSNWMAH